MKSYDFEYNGLALSDLGYTICSFNSKGLQTISNGSQINFNTVSFNNGEKHELISSEYSECLTTTFQICKNICFDNNIEIPFREYRDLMSWLNRKGFHKFKLLEDEYWDMFFEASFNISRIELDGKLCGLELNMVTNRPFALKEPQTINIKNSTENFESIIINESDEEGYIYPYMEITLNQDGDFNIYNEAENRNTYIKNCMAGEKIICNYPIIQSSVSSHKIQNDFNWNFFRLARKFKSGENKLTISLPCEIKMTYSPIVKVSI